MTEKQPKLLIPSATGLRRGLLRAVYRSSSEMAAATMTISTM